MSTVARSKVCIITSINPALDVRIFHKQAKALVEAGYDVTLIAPHDQNDRIAGIDILALPKPKNRLCRWMNTIRILKLLFSNHAQIYHLHNPELIFIGGWLKIFRKRAKVFYDAHEDYRADILDKAWLPRWCRRPVAYLFDQLEKQVTKNFDGVIAATDYIQSRFTAHRVIAVRNYPPLKLIHQAARRSYQVPDQPILIYVGSLTPIRGIMEIVEAVGLLKDAVRLVLIGTWGDRSFEASIRTSRHFSKVDYLGSLPWERVWPHLITATIGLVCFHPTPAHVTAGPNKLFEYMAAGIPVIASNFPQWRQLIETNHCGLTVNPLDPVQIAHAVEYLLAHPGQVSRMGQQGQKLIAERFNWECEKERLLSFYEHVTHLKL